MLKARYREENNCWQIVFETQQGREFVVMEYSLDLVPLSYIVNTAVANGKLPPQALFTEEGVTTEVIEWFASSVFPSSAFGRDLLKDFKDFVSLLLSQTQQEVSTRQGAQYTSVPQGIN